MVDIVMHQNEDSSRPCPSMNCQYEAKYLLRVIVADVATPQCMYWLKVAGLTDIEMDHIFVDTVNVYQSNYNLKSVVAGEVPAAAYDTDLVVLQEQSHSPCLTCGQKGSHYNLMNCHEVQTHPHYYVQPGVLEVQRYNNCRGLIPSTFLQEKTLGELLTALLQVSVMIVYHWLQAPPVQKV